MCLLKIGDYIGITACSNGMSESSKSIIEDTKKRLEDIGLRVELSNCIYSQGNIFTMTEKERANELMKFIKDDKIKAIFDVSGGDAANGILEYLDYEEIRIHNKPFFGYSDLSVVLNAINTKSNINTYLYQIRNIVRDNSKTQLRCFKETIIEGKNSLYDIDYRYIQGKGKTVSGVVVGGNIRCFLKLSGTEYFPKLDGKILLLESMGGDLSKIYTFLIQLRQIGVFKSIKGIILGTFTQVEDDGKIDELCNLVKSIVNNIEIPIVKTQDIGHGKDSRCIVIGKEFTMM